MSLDTFARSSYTVAKGTPEHDKFMSYLLDCLPPASREPVVIITRDTGPVIIPVPQPDVLSNPSPDIRNLHITPEDVTGRFELASELVKDSKCDISGYLLMAAGRFFGSYLRNELLDGDGGMFVRLAREAEVVFERAKSADGSPVLAFTASMSCRARRASDTV